MGRHVGGEKEYAYPFDMDWTTDEIVLVIDFYQAIEQAYEKGIPAAELKERYKAFKQVVPSKSEEKRLDKEFEEASGFSSYRVVSQLKDGKEKIKM
ncbi:UPF0223 family protein [Mangrovibacillus cuniculi]|uniref:UPF0223 family protein n=1 Tax=Mangrovibacillus cuniculi TaxID=2593652 RepID=A0A7S8CAF9_9BACI|nr:UPF0223 family protein [Mangrovibacillus cuniculi]QPC46198.1 UPF0223 family protein [Mangrovibacillus cuniculi]